MGKNASGMYAIDEDYKIISYNLAAREIYPQLKSGEKCYHCLRNRETPCEICPVINGIKGPKNYLEPGRNILRSVDAVEIPLESGGTGHALVFSDTETKRLIRFRYAASRGRVALMWRRDFAGMNPMRRSWIFILRAVLRQRTGSGCIR
ncbi:MAG: hypothetical protein KH027_01110 [Clostridiales bacterium]|nr:hypothetical protein [Clostridiales bacterium]